MISEILFNAFLSIPATLGKWLVGGCRKSLIQVWREGDKEGFGWAGAFGILLFFVLLIFCLRALN
jgi:hypothetical protein